MDLNSIPNEIIEQNDRPMSWKIYFLSIISYEKYCELLINYFEETGYKSDGDGYAALNAWKNDKEREELKQKLFYSESTK